MKKRLLRETLAVNTADYIEGGSSSRVAMPVIYTTRVRRKKIKVDTSFNRVSPKTIPGFKSHKLVTESLAKTQEQISAISVVDTAARLSPLLDYANESQALLLMRHNIAIREKKLKHFPCLTIKAAAKILGCMDPSNSSKYIDKCINKGLIFSLKDATGKRSIPQFQINPDTLKPYLIISPILAALDVKITADYDGWPIYNWFVSALDDQDKYIPAQMLNDPKEHDDLLYYAEQAGAELAGRALV